MATKASIPQSRAHRSPLAAISANYDLELEKLIEYDQCQPKQPEPRLGIAVLDELSELEVVVCGEGVPM